MILQLIKITEVDIYKVMMMTKEEEPRSRSGGEVKNVKGEKVRNVEGESMIIITITMMDINQMGKIYRMMIKTMTKRDLAVDLVMRE